VITSHDQHKNCVEKCNNFLKGNIQGVSGGIVYIFGGGSTDYSE